MQRVRSLPSTRRFGLCPCLRGHAFGWLARGTRITFADRQPGLQGLHHVDDLVLGFLLCGKGGDGLALDLALNQSSIRSYTSSLYFSG
jgi:hypothetical protein